MIRAKAVLAYASHWIISFYLLGVILACDNACAVNLMSVEDFRVSAYHSELFLPFNRNFLENWQISGFPVLPFRDFQPSGWNLAWCDIIWLYLMKNGDTKKFMNKSRYFWKKKNRKSYIWIFKDISSIGKMDFHSWVGYFSWVCCIQTC